MTIPFMVEDDAGTKYWYRDKNALDAIIHPNSVVILHRLDGPAIENDRFCMWYIHGFRYTSAKQFQLAADLTDEEMVMLVLKHGEIS